MKLQRCLQLLCKKFKAFASQCSNHAIKSIWMLSFLFNKNVYNLIFLIQCLEYQDKVLVFISINKMRWYMLNLEKMNWWIVKCILTYIKITKYNAQLFDDLLKKRLVITHFGLISHLRFTPCIKHGRCEPRQSHGSVEFVVTCRMCWLWLSTVWWRRGWSGAVVPGCNKIV